MPDVRPGNASINARAARRSRPCRRPRALVGQWLPVDAHGRITIGELCERRDGGPREARYGQLRSRVLSVGTRGLRFGSEAVKDVAGYDVRRAWLGEVLVAQATLRLAARLPWRSDVLVRGGDAFALAETLRALAAAPAAILVVAPDLLAISDDAPAAQVDRREHDLAVAAVPPAPSSNTSKGTHGSAVATPCPAPACGSPRETRACRCQSSTSPGCTTRAGASRSWRASRPPRGSLLRDEAGRRPSSSAGCERRSGHEPPRSRCRHGRPARRPARQLHLLRLLPARVPDLPADGRGERVAARPHRARRRAPLGGADASTT